MKRYFGFYVIIVFFLTNCSVDDSPLSSQSSSDFSIFMLQDSTITFQEADTSELSELTLKDEPWLNIDDISLYDFSTHFVYLKINKDQLFEDMMDNSHIFTDFLIKPFVLTAGNERIFLGSFISSLSSYAYGGPHINDLEQYFLPSDILSIQGCNYSECDDQRNDYRIKEALQAGNIYHAGLNVTLTDVEIVENSDISTVRYSFVIKNNDTDDLYIPDPDLMGTELFHYYTNGVDFWSSDQHYYYSQYKITSPPVPSDSWKSDWFIKLNSGKSIERTVVLRGYSKFSNDTYNCSFRFAGPKRIDLSQRIFQGGRYWIGGVTSNTLSFVY